jgi:hypothetical protein
MSIDQRIREGLRTVNDDMPMPDVEAALATVIAGGQQTHRRHVVAALAAAAAVVAVIAGLTALNNQGTDSQQPIDPPTETPTDAETDKDSIPVEPSEVISVSQVRGRGLEVEGEAVPGNWELLEARRDVWVAIKTDENEVTSQWWGKGATPHPVPPSVGDILPGGVVISQDAHWIAWTRPAADVNSTNPPMVMEVVDTATGEVRWSRNADADVRDVGPLAVTNDGVVVFAHCLEPVLDSDGLQRCADARVDVWAPEADVVGTLPAGVRVGDAPFPDVPPTLGPLVQRMGAHNGLLVQSAEMARPQYIRVSEGGDVEVVATLPAGGVKAVTADERFALLGGRCDDGEFGCGWSVLPLDGGQQSPIPSLTKLVSPQTDYLYGFVVERDDLLLVQEPVSGAIVARCGLAQARCVRIEK